MTNEKCYLEQIIDKCEQDGLDANYCSRLIENAIKEVRQLGPYNNLNELIKYLRDPKLVVNAVIDYIVMEDKAKMATKHEEMMEKLYDSINIPKA